MKTDLRVSITKRMIKESLLQLLEQKPMDKIRVNELCLQSGINRATFYRHYETLQDVLQEIEKDITCAMPQPSRQLYTVEEVREYLEQVFSYIYGQNDVMKILILNRTDEEMLQGITEFYWNYLDAYLNTLPIDRPDEDTIQIAVALLSGGCHYLLKKCVMGHIRKTPRELADILCNMIRLQESFPLFSGN